MSRHTHRRQDEPAADEEPRVMGSTSTPPDDDDDDNGEGEGKDEDDDEDAPPKAKGAKAKAVDDEAAAPADDAPLCWCGRPEKDHIQGDASHEFKKAEPPKEPKKDKAAKAKPPKGPDRETTDDVSKDIPCDACGQLEAAHTSEATHVYRPKLPPTADDVAAAERKANPPIPEGSRPPAG